MIPSKCQLGKRPQQVLDDREGCLGHRAKLRHLREELGSRAAIGCTKDANGTRRVDAATVPGQIARPDYERTILAR